MLGRALSQRIPVLDRHLEVHDKDRDGALSEEELDSLFVTAPDNRHPWQGTGFPASTITDEHGAVTLQGWLAQWSMTTLLDHRTTLAYLAYLGYPSFPLAGSSSSSSTPRQYRSRPPAHLARDPHATAHHVRLPLHSVEAHATRKTDKKKKGAIQRSVFLGFVLGAAGSGKTAILRNMVGKRFANGTSRRKR